MRQVIRFSTSGKFKSIYSDKLASLNLGDFRVERASDVEYDHTRKVWIARERNGKFLCESPSREECVKREVEILSKQITQ